MQDYTLNWKPCPWYFEHGDIGVNDIGIDMLSYKGLEISLAELEKTFPKEKEEAKSDFDSLLEDYEKQTHLEYWLEFFGMPKENIEKAVTQIAQGYGAKRFLDGVSMGAEAVHSLKEETEIDLDSEITDWILKSPSHDAPTNVYIMKCAKHFFNLGKG